MAELTNEQLLKLEILKIILNSKEWNDPWYGSQEGIMRQRYWVLKYMINNVYNIIEDKEE